MSKFVKVPININEELLLQLVDWRLILKVCFLFNFEALNSLSRLRVYGQKQLFLANYGYVAPDEEACYMKLEPTSKDYMKHISNVVPIEY